MLHISHLFNRVRHFGGVLGFLAGSVLVGLPSASAHAGVVISEVMPSNLATYMDETYNFGSWVEVFNNGSSAVNLNGYTFRVTASKDLLVNEAVVDFDLSLKAGERRLLFFDKRSEQGHFSFKLDADGVMVVLLDDAGAQVSSVKVPDICAYVSYGLGSDGKLGYMEPTPLKANGKAFAAANLAALRSSLQAADVTFGTAPGLYLDADSVVVSLASATAGASIVFTTDGSIPTASNGSPYSKPFGVKKSTVVRARAFSDGRLPSGIATASYLFNDKAHSYCGWGDKPVAVVSISTNDEYFNDDQIGIGVTGKNGAPSDKDCIKGSANFLQDWARPVNFEFMEGGRTVVNAELMASVLGGCSRGYDVKSLKLAAGKICGSGKNKMKYAFFSDKPQNTKYKSLHLRNGGNDFDGIRFRDGFMQSLIHGLNVDYQAYRPVAYYINGKYQGLMDLNERVSGDYVYTNYGLDDEQMDFVEIASHKVGAKEGDTKAYDEMVRQSGIDISSAGYYDRMNRLLDLDEYINYMVFEQFIVNTDWVSNNVKMWRKRDDGRFRYIIYDTDFGFGMYGGAGPNYTTYTTDMIQYSLGQGSVVNWGNGSLKSPYTFDQASRWKTKLFRNLMQNEKFRLKYLTRSMMLLSNEFSTPVVKAHWDSISADAYNEYCASKNPNQYWKASYEKDETVSAILSFAENRPKVVYSNLAGYFGGSLISLDITSNTQGAAFNVNGVYSGGDYHTKYVSNTMLNVSPIAPDGYKFDHWNLSASASKELVNSKTTWRYLYDGSYAGDGWTQVAFDDAAWSQGHGLMGYGSKTHSYDTPLDYGDDADNKHLTGYFRSDFVLDDTASFSKISGELTYDDGAIVYVNGNEVLRVNMPEGDVTSKSVALDYVNDATQSLEIPSKFLLKGLNVIAVEVHQNVATSSDFTFGLHLTGVGKPTGVKQAEPAYSGELADNFSMEAVFVKSASPACPLVINEVCTSNKSDGGFADAYGSYGDWIEVYNTSSEPYNMAGLFISDNASNRRKYCVSFDSPDQTTIPGHGHSIIWCTPDSWQGPLYTGFKLSETKTATLLLSREVCGSLVTVDSLTYSAGLGANNTWGRKKDGDSTFVKFLACDDSSKVGTLMPSPLAANGSVVYGGMSGFDYILASPAESVRIYPNPAVDFVSVSAASGSINSIQVADVSGRLVLSKSVSGSSFLFSVAALSPGVYIVKVNTSDGAHQLKLIKK